MNSFVLPIRSNPLRLPGFIHLGSFEPGSSTLGVIRLAPYPHFPIIARARCKADVRAISQTIDAQPFFPPTIKEHLLKFGVLRQDELRGGLHRVRCVLDNPGKRQMVECESQRTFDSIGLEMGYFHVSSIRMPGIGFGILTILPWGNARHTLECPSKEALRTEGKQVADFSQRQFGVFEQRLGLGYLRRLDIVADRTTGFFLELSRHIIGAVASERCHIANSQVLPNMFVDEITASVDQFRITASVLLVMHAIGKIV